MSFVGAFDLCTYLVALWGYAALLLTGQFNPLLIVGCMLLVFVAWYCHRRGWHLRNMYTNSLTAIAFVVACVMAMRNLLDAGICFIMVLLIIKLFSKRTTADALWVYVVSLFEVVGAAVVTSSLAFAPVFVGYVILMTTSLVLLTIRRGYEATGKVAMRIRRRAEEQAFAPGALRMDNEWEAQLLSGRTRINLAFPMSCALTSIAILIVTAIFFMAIPRLSPQKTFESGLKPISENAMSAFAENIEFGSLEKIQLDPAIALYVRPLGSERPDHVRLRGVALDTFDGKTWRRTPVAVPMEAPLFQFTRQMLRETRLSLIIQPPGVTNFLFGETFPESMQLPTDLRYYVDPLSCSVWQPYALNRQVEYRVISRIEDLEKRSDPSQSYPAPGLSDNTTDPLSLGPRLNRALRSVTANSEANEDTIRRLRLDRFLRVQTQPSHDNNRRLDAKISYLLRCLQLPDSLRSARIKNLAQEWTSQAHTPYEKARAIEERLRRTYNYSLEPRARGNYIEDFLFNTREGHCEFFATSMAVLLRNLAIPARVVNGFYSVEWNQMANAFSVRQRDAHSWVEVYFENYGWMTFDPTPSSGVGRPVPYSPAYAAMNRFIDALKVSWYRHVIDYGFSDQIGFIRMILQATDRMLKSLNAHSFVAMQDLSFEGSSKGIYVVLIFMGLVGLGLFYFGFRWLRHVVSSLKTRRQSTSKTLIKYYADLLARLTKLGFVRAAHETPREFASRVVDGSPELEPFRQITELYYGSRFNAAVLAPEEWEQIRSFTDAVQRAIKRPSN